MGANHLKEINYYVKLRNLILDYYKYRKGLHVEGFGSIENFLRKN